MRPWAKTEDAGEGYFTEQIKNFELWANVDVVSGKKDLEGAEVEAPSRPCLFCSGCSAYLAAARSEGLTQSGAKCD